MQSEAICTNDIEGLSAETFIPVEFLYCDASQQSHSQDALSIVELGKQLLLNAKNGDTEAVRDLMCRGAPFTTDWVPYSDANQLSAIPIQSFTSVNFIQKQLGTSALHLAAQNNHVDTAEVLLRAGISRDARTKVDRTPLHMAAYEGHHQMALLLLNYGADVDSRDMLKMTPLHWAVEREHIEVMHVLLEHGADPNATSKFDKTPISLALEHDRLDIVDILQQEREILSIQAQHQTQANSTEIEDATHSLMQMEAERHQEQQQQQLDIQQQFQQQKRKISQVQTTKRQKMVFQQIQMPATSDDEQDKDAELAERINSIEHSTFKKHKDMGAFGSLEQPLRLLQAHGITMIPVDNDASIVENAMESGRTVVLTEAGKLALNLTRTAPLGVKRLPVGSRKGVPRKVIAIRADQILGQNPPVLTPRGPNILKRSTTAESKSGKLFLASLSNKTITASRATVPSTRKKVAVSQPQNPIVLHLDDDIEEITEDSNPAQESGEPAMDIETLNKRLEETERLAAEYRKQLQIKEEEAELYKQQLRNMTAQRAAK